MNRKPGSAAPPNRKGRSRGGAANGVDWARRAAFDLQAEVREDGAYANLVWPAILDHRGVGGRDAAFATELAYGTLRWRGRHDAVLAACATRSLAELDPALLDALRIGVHQLHNMRVGAHAAVSETVELVRNIGHPRAAGLANAVLRKVAAGGSSAEWLARLAQEGRIPARTDDPEGYWEVAGSHPRWIVAALHRALAGSGTPGGDNALGGRAQAWAETERLLAADNTPGGVTLVARTIARDELLERLRASGWAAQPGRWSDRALRLATGAPAHIPEVATGAAGVQDEGSQVVALALAGAPLTGSDTRWLDLCAGPGGKAALLAGEVAGRGGSLTAVELHEHRAELVRNALRPISGRHQVVCADALNAPLGDGFDRVLVDAPCTGLGALRRRPEARWRRSEADLAQLVPLQRALLARALQVVRPGGLVLYATCSPHLGETDEVVATALAEGAELVPPPAIVPAELVGEGVVRTWPHRHDTDGMFAALLRRPS